MTSLWVTSGGRLVPLEVDGYAREKDFQSLLADNPGVLAGALDSGESEPRWLLVDRELPILSDEQENSTRWSLDHLFIDGLGRPTLVEVKRSSDPRARREVVAQMLDYAASFGPDWSAERLRERRQARLRTAAPGADDEMSAFLEATFFESEDHMWGEVATNIEAGRIRLLFVADELSERLVKIIEYLNGQMQMAEVLGVEVVRHTSSVEGIEAYQPVVRGQSSARAQKKSSSHRQTKESFDRVLTQNHGTAVLDSINQLVAWAKKAGGFVSIGTDESSPRLFLNFHTSGDGKLYWPLAVNPRSGKVALFLQYLKHHPSFEDDDVRLQFVQRMSGATGFAIDENRLGGRPGFPVEKLIDPGVLSRVEDVLRWVISTADSCEE
jgi:hypothetical protein